MSAFRLWQRPWKNGIPSFGSFGSFHRERLLDREAGREQCGLAWLRTKSRNDYMSDYREIVPTGWEPCQWKRKFEKAWELELSIVPITNCDSTWSWRFLNGASWPTSWTHHNMITYYIEDCLRETSNIYQIWETSVELLKLDSRKPFPTQICKVPSCLLSTLSCRSSSSRKDRFGSLSSRYYTDLGQ